MTADGISTLKLDANFDSCAPSGEYRCLWTNGAQQLNAPLVPQSASMPAHVVIRDPDDPWVLTQPAADVVRVGEPAKYKVDARLGLGGTDEDVLVYIWQMSRDGGRTWQNCVAERDGTGQFTDTFTTVPVTGATYAPLAAASAGDLQDSIFQYRCIVANRRLNNAVVSAAAPLVILPGTPEISPGPGSSLSVISFGDVRYLRGVTATAAGTTVDAMLHDLRYDAPVGYYVRVMIPHVGEVPAEDVFFTGMDVELVNAATNDVVDRVVAVVRGDVLGTGKLALSQLVRLARAYSGAEPLEGPFELAATVKGSGGAISLTDLVSAAALFQDSSK